MRFPPRSGAVVIQRLKTLRLTLGRGGRAQKVLSIRSGMSAYQATADAVKAALEN
jgi:hypothetical protein